VDKEERQAGGGGPITAKTTTDINDAEKRPKKI